MANHFTQSDDARTIDFYHPAKYSLPVFIG